MQLYRVFAAEPLWVDILYVALLMEAADEGHLLGKICCLCPCKLEV